MKTKTDKYYKLIAYTGETLEQTKKRVIEKRKKLSRKKVEKLY